MRLGKPRWRDALNVGLVGAIYCAIAIPIAYKLQTNYGNILDSVIPIMEDLRLEHGQVKYTECIVAVLTLGSALSSFLCIGLDLLVGGFFKLFSSAKNKEKIYK